MSSGDPQAHLHPAPGRVFARSIAFLVNTLTHGGAEVQVARLALSLRRRGWAVSVISMTAPTALVEELESGGVMVHCLRMRRGVPDPAALFRLRSILRAQRPTVVHSHIVHANILARVARLICPMPVLVSTAHNTNEGGRLRELAYRFTDGLADLTTNVSQASVDRYVAVKAAPAHRIRFVANGLDTEQFKPDAQTRRQYREQLQLNERFAWLAIGRLEEAKDYPNLLRAFSRVVADAKAEERALHPPAQAAAAPPPVLLIVGQGKLRDTLQQLAATHQIAEHVRFLGVRGDVRALMNAADGYAMSSAWEGMPLVLQEASATGLPIVATKVGGNAEVVVDGQSGHLVPPHESAALAAAMLQIMRLPREQRQTMGQAGRDHVSACYGLEGIVDRWEEIYAELLNDRGRLEAKGTAT